ncbi:MAG TPA: hypothetical protein VJ878_01305, partial [Candidatus Izemoplasmatales bacterium]|nr:hypothetical protein [Candidatus Izemoplasmatales bacterium]
MKELTKYLMPFIKILLVPYLVLMFLLLYRLDNYYINAPGGITNVDTLIDINYDVDDIEGSFSSTYVISFRKPTVFQFVISDFSNYNNVHILPTSLVHLTDSEVRTISYLQKDESVSNAIISAYKLASESNSEVVFDAGYEEVYKVDMKDSD